MLEGGILVALGLLVVMAKISWRWKMRMVSNPVATDLLVFVLLLTLHWGTFSGVMVATIGSLVCSVVLSLARKMYGHINGNRYYPGVFNIVDRL